MITQEEALALLVQAQPEYGLETVDLLAAAGRVLREEICADREHPPFDRVSMDGVAIRLADWEAGRRTFRIDGCQAAGAAPRPLRAEAGLCLEAMTGAVLPPGTDGVIPVEMLVREGNQVTVAAEVEFGAWLNIHRRGSDHAAGTVLVPSGAVLNGPRLALAATAGRTKLTVARLPKAAVVATGDELVAPGSKPAPWQIRRSNSIAMASALRAMGLDVAEMHIPDKQGELFHRLAALLEERQLIVLSGGVSAGKFDLLPATLRELGCDILFHKVAQRPGKPLLVARRGAALIYGLPGNPVSAVVNFQRYVVEQLRLSLGLAPGRRLVTLEEEVRFGKSLTLFQPVSLREGEDGRLWARPLRGNGSGDHGALAWSDGFVELSPGQEHPSGAVRPFYGWS